LESSDIRGWFYEIDPTRVQDVPLPLEGLKSEDEASNFRGLEEDLAKVRAHVLGLQHIDLPSITIEEAALNSIPGDVARRFGVIPTRRRGNRLEVAVSIPKHYMPAMDIVRRVSECTILPVIANQSDIDEAIRKAYPDIASATVDEIQKSSETFLGLAIVNSTVEHDASNTVVVLAASLDPSKWSDAVVVKPKDWYEHDATVGVYASRIATIEKTQLRRYCGYLLASEMTKVDAALKLQLGFA